MLSARQEFRVQTMNKMLFKESTLREKLNINCVFYPKTAVQIFNVWQCGNGYYNISLVFFTIPGETDGTSGSLANVTLRYQYFLSQTHLGVAVGKKTVANVKYVPAGEGMRLEEGKMAQWWDVIHSEVF